MTTETSGSVDDDARTARVAIVGGGAAGTLIALQLAADGIASTIVDRNGAFARGVAFGATSPWHRLNVPIDKMGGWSASENDRGFHAWYVANRGPLSERYADRYVSRADYGAWLRAELDVAAAKGFVDLRTADVRTAVQMNAEVHLGLAEDETMIAPIAIFCPGNQKPRPLPLVVPSSRYVADMWVPGILATIAPDKPVLIVGTGATGIDALLELHHRGHQAPIWMLSRRGLLPLEDAPPAPYTFERTIRETCRLRDVMRLLREEADAAVAENLTWQSVVDAFRIHLPRLWNGLSERERGQFLRHLRSYWLIHRHRLAPDIATLVRELQADSRVSVLSGRMRAVCEQADGLAIDIDERTGGTKRLVVADVINCTGPDEDFRRINDPLAGYLLGSGAARPGAFGVGLDVDDHGRLLRADGSAQTRIFVLGGATRMRFGEVTSAPQIRRRAAHLAGTIARVLRGA